MAVLELSKSEVLRNIIVSEREKLHHLKDFDETNTVPYQNFFQKYLLPNKPCIFSATLTEKWTSRRDWVCDGAPDLALLRSLFGSGTAPVANCKEEQYSAHPKQDMTLTEYIDYWEDYRAKGYPESDPCLYLKDWHFTMAFPDYRAYSTPVYFLSDWLNEFWDTLADQDDYRFVYMGPKGSWTPFHADVYRSYSWSANICGRKLWIFYPPGEEEQLKDRFGKVIYDVTSSELEDKSRYPNYTKHSDRRLEIIQEQGQIIFVPSGWYHQVYNLEDTISINHNWLNGCNIDICWDHLKENLCYVKKEIADCEGMEGWHAQCQLILKASAGIDYNMFYELLRTVAEKRLEMLQEMNGKHVHETKESDIHRQSFEDLTEDLNKDLKVSNAVVDKKRDFEALQNQQQKNLNTVMEQGVLSTDTDLDKQSKKSDVTAEEYSCACVFYDRKGADMVSKSASRKIKSDSDHIRGSGNETIDKSSEPENIIDMFLLPKQPGDRDHIMFDLHRIETVLTQVTSDSDFQHINTEKDILSYSLLLKRIKDAIS